MAGHRPELVSWSLFYERNGVTASLAGKVSDKMNLVEYSARDGSCLS